jgi:hypothetical protein
MRVDGDLEEAAGAADAGGLWGLLVSQVPRHQTLFDFTRILAAGALAEAVLSTGHPVGVVI